MTARTHHRLIALILLLAIGLRAWGFSPYALHHPDEALQYLEQAHRLVTGQGLIPWEYRLGMRSWLVPLLLAGPMCLGEALAPGTLLGVLLARLAAVALAFAPIIAALSIGRRVSPAHGLMAMAVTAIWYESVYFSVHVLTETLSVAAFLSAVAVLAPQASRRRLIAGGALLALSAVVRFHYAPAIAVFALFTFRLRWRDWGWVLLGGAATALLSGAIDLAMGQWPFAWAYQNFHQNVVADKASEFGRAGPGAYLQMLWHHWGVAMVPILWLAALSARRFPALAAAALVNFALHMAIGHKEYRFILLSTEIAILLAAIGSADLLDRARRARPWQALSRRAVTVAAILLWTATSTALAVTASPGWRRFEAGPALAWEAARHGACGIAIAGNHHWVSGGHAFSGGVPIYSIFGRNPAAEAAQMRVAGHGFNAVIALPSWSRKKDFAEVACRGQGSERLCLTMRSGGCRSDSMSETRRMQTVMQAHGR